MRAILTAGVAAGLVLAATPAFAAPMLEQWNCRLSSGAQHWGVEAGELVTDMPGLPIAMTRLPIVKNTPGVVMAVSDEYAGRRFQVVLIDKLKSSIRIVTMGAESGAQNADSGGCVSGFARSLPPMPYAQPVPGQRVAAPPQRPVASSAVRGAIKSLLQQAEALTAQGYYDAALRKLVQTDEFTRRTPEEDSLIAQTRAYIMQKSRGKARL